MSIVADASPLGATRERTSLPPLTTLAEIHEARDALPACVRKTPLVALSRDSSEVEAERLFLKAECLQITGAYKIRAVFNVMRLLSAEQRKCGVVMTSSGNFAQAFAFAGRTLGVPVAVVMLDDTSSYKVEVTRGHGAEVVFCALMRINANPPLSVLRPNEACLRSTPGRSNQFPRDTALLAWRSLISALMLNRC